MNIQSFLKQLLLIIFLYNSSTSCAPLIALLCGGVGGVAQGVAAGAIIGSASAQKETDRKFAIAQNEQQALVAGNAQLLETNAKLKAQCGAMRHDTEQLNERRAQLAQGLSLLSEALTRERHHRVILEEDRNDLNQQLKLQQLRNSALQHSSRFHQKIARGSLGVLCIGACIGYWNYHRHLSRSRTKLDLHDKHVPPISPIDHQNEIRDISHHHRQSEDQSHQMRLRYDG